MSNIDQIDSIELEKREDQSVAKLKFVTTNYLDSNSWYGINIRDTLFTPSESIQEDSQLRYGIEGNVNTNYRVKTQLGQLPLPTMPYRYGSTEGDINIENELLNFDDLRDRKGGIPLECTLYNRSFSIFGNDMESPNPIKGVESDQDFGPRGGYPSRFD